MDEELLYAPAITLIELIRNRQISPVELTRAVVERIEALQPIVNAFITVTADQALAGAEAAEQAIIRGDPTGVMCGIPFSVKDLTYTAGVTTTMGSYIYENFVPNEDAVPVARLKAAGAILIGKTTTPEFGHKPLTDAPLFGRTRNPWHLERTCGGSSGGAAVAVAAGMAPLALGTDGGGSIRIPASCCGIVGLKPTLGRIPHIHAPDLFGNNSYIGPMTRTIADARLMFDIMAGPDPRDPYAMAEPPRRPGLPAKLTGVRIGWAPAVGNRVDAEVLAHAERTVRLLESLGAAIEHVDEDFVSLEPLFLTLLQTSMRARFGQHVAGFGDRLSRSLVHTIEQGARWTTDDLSRVGTARSDLFRRIQSLFARFDFLVSPTLSAPALPIAQDAFGPVAIGGEEAGSIRGAWYPYTYPFNLTGHPAVSIPCGWTRDGLPVGFQIVGPWSSDHWILDLAERIEREQPWADIRPTFAG